VLTAAAVAAAAGYKATWAIADGLPLPDSVVAPTS
jgi:hypothetical protein